MTWKHHNDCVFNGGQPNIKDEAALWASAGASGLRLVLLQTWDVH
jgi:hypothetical protein